MRIGLFGGSYNPIHFGHLRAAEEVREALKLDLVYFIPAAAPPHKNAASLAPADHRYKMAQLGIKGNRYFMVSDVEVRRSGPSYTIDTLRHFIASMKGGPDFHLLLGGDQFAEIDTWKECGELMRLSNLVVHTRENDKNEPLRVSLAALTRFGYAKKDDHYVHQSGHTLSFIATTYLPIAASLIRQKIAAHESIRYLLPADVADYIQRHNVY